ncbi:MAG: hypothetical protein LBB23_01755 [Rickettsiales bacterium]|jgi:hypothetical protein|nr:hypothetical protein [Rickettsiales bacterium]
MFRKVAFLAIILSASVFASSSFAACTDATSCKSEAQTAYNAAAEKLAEAKKKLESAQRTQQALGVAAMGIGGMQLAQGLAQNAAEEEGKKRLEDYQKTWMCGVGSASATDEGRINWFGATVGAGQVGTVPAPKGLPRLIADFTAKQNQIKAAKGEMDMVLTEEEQMTFAANNLYGRDDGLAEGELATQSTGGGNTRIAIGAGLAGAGAMLSMGDGSSGVYKNALGAGLITGGGAGALVAKDTKGQVIGGLTAVGGAGVLTNGFGLIGAGKKDEDGNKLGVLGNMGSGLSDVAKNLGIVGK